MSDMTVLFKDEIKKYVTDIHQDFNEIVIKKEVTADYQKAEGMAEEYVLAEEKKGPSFLVEKWNDV